MNRKEKNWVYRISKKSFAKAVQNPADIKEKMLYYAEQEKLREASFTALISLIESCYDDKDKEFDVKNLEQTYDNIYSK